MSCQLLTRGLTYWFPPEGDVVVGYVSAARTRVVAAAPVCSPERLAEVTRAFATDAASHGERVCYFGAQAPLLDALAWQTPTARMVLGAEPGWDPAHWPNVLRRKASLRAQLARARHKGVTVVAVDPEVARCEPAGGGDLWERAPCKDAHAKARRRLRKGAQGAHGARPSAKTFAPLRHDHRGVPVAVTGASTATEKVNCA
ncbi:DUF2156 domain-containing protein [Candidatus Chloroploca sp. M-50]|uniref:DUF2156 domain-containing protein n=2 Tax=Candidatus Chloroploca mongolica TaxID=2528176 RepID=A0ABS4D6F2_9CHLR|nr:DUF2156 domain-containing protein [Candidatus Chloroploca mongolica]